MKDRTLIEDVKGKVGEEVIIAGFVQAIRDQGGIIFLIIRDVSALIQCVVLKSNERNFELAKNLTIESVVKITGKAKEEKQAPNGFEVEVEQMEVLSEAAPEMPIPVVVEKGGEETSAPKRFDWRVIDLRKTDKQKVFKVWTSLEKGCREHFYQNRFLQIYPPSLMNAPSEGGSEVFEVGYFERKAYLAQSPQFYKQMAMASGFEKVFAVGPVFRAEESFTTRHMTEFTGWDFEISYIDSHHDVMDEEEKMIISGFSKVNEEMKLDIEVPTAPFPRLTLKEAKNKLSKAGVKSEKEHDLSPEEERKINEIVKDESGHEFVFITDYDISIRPFYHMRYVDKPDTTMSFDLIYKGVEITTGAQREHRYDILEKQAIEKGVDPESVRDYLNFFKYGCPPHGGAGIGPGRIIMGMLKLDSVKEATFLPRDVKRLSP